MRHIVIRQIDATRLKLIRLLHTSELAVEVRVVTAASAIIHTLIPIIHTLILTVEVWSQPRRPVSPRL